VVHDVGKIAIPDSIILKPTSLSADEWKVMREHPVVGERICAPLKSFRLVLPIIRHHHEKFDGSGYPDGLRGEDIPIAVGHIRRQPTLRELPIFVMTAKTLSEQEIAILGRETQAFFPKGGPWQQQLISEINRVIQGKRAKAASTL